MEAGRGKNGGVYGQMDREDGWSMEGRASQGPVLPVVVVVSTLL